MNILLIGLGSIGTRHANNLLSLGYKNISIVSHSEQLPQAFSTCMHFRNLEDALQHQTYDATIICTATAQHASQLIQLLKHKIKLIYVEKPVSNSLENIETVKQLTDSYTNKIVVGFDLHFDPGMQKTKELLQSNAIGKIISVHAFVGQHLPQWRPYEDHRKGMSAKKETGGGVLLDLIHEFEYLHRLFGDIDEIKCYATNTGVLEIETEESADVLLKFKNGITGTVHLDYWQQQLIRSAIITGTEGTITWNPAEKFVLYTSKQGTEKFSFARAERNDRFLTAMKNFLEEKDDERLSTLQDGIKSLEIVLAAKRSAGLI
jgi:predicted dehydrogenase